ncbi:hypothetical protein GCM10022234_22510 [Aeromicrobium panaciterrae]|uniref:hypothetical protein n=1 Tax=Aeromicrobium panaciterrae TaxID=363861 RepID=UPI0031DE12E6
MNAANFAPWPRDGVVRVHPAPMELPAESDDPGPYRFDDPRRRTQDRFLMRYTASTVRGCLLELLDWMRDDEAAHAREASVEVDDDPGFVDPPSAAGNNPLEAYLLERRVATMTAGSPTVVSIDDPAVQAKLDRENGVRAVLDAKPARDALLEERGHEVHLDNAAVRLASKTGRDLTQACALALYDWPHKPDVIHYRSRHNDTEDCWAIYSHVSVYCVHEVPLSPDIPAHREALESVAKIWDLEIPTDWVAGH